MPCANLCKRIFFRICWLKTKNHSNLGGAWPDCSQRRCGKGWSSNSGRLKITCVCITYYVLCMQMHTHMFHGYCFSSIQTWRLDQDTLLSNLTLHRAGPGDKGHPCHVSSLFSSSSSPGNYTCSLPGELSSLGEHTVRVHILDYELPVAVHSGYEDKLYLT